MMEIIGQKKIIDFIDTSSFDSFPRSLMLVGEKGSGRKTICEYISKKFNLIMEPLLPDDVVNMSLTQIIKERIDAIYTDTSLPRLYYIDGDFFISRGRGELNSLLKLLEEPLPTIFLVFFCETTANVLPTITNRCYQLIMEPYSDEDLKSFLTDSDWSSIINIVHNPGQLKYFRRYTPQQVEEGVNFFIKVPDLMKRAAYPNVFRISDKRTYFGGKEDKNSVSFTPREIALILMFALKQLYYKENDEHYYKAFCLTNKFYNDLNIFNIDEKVLFEHYLIELKTVITK